MFSSDYRHFPGVWFQTQDIFNLFVLIWSLYFLRFSNICYFPQTIRKFLFQLKILLPVIATFYSENFLKEQIFLAIVTA